MSVPSQNQQNSQLDTEKKEHEIEKLKLEQEKLKLENKELNKHWTLKREWIGLWVTVIVSLTTLVIFSINGVFDSKRQELKTEKLVLEWQKIQFSKDVDSLKIKRDSLEIIIKSFQDSMGILRNNIRELSSDKEILIRITGGLKSDLSKRTDSCSMYIGYLMKLRTFAQANHELSMETLRDENKNLKDSITKLLTK